MHIQKDIAFRFHRCRVASSPLDPDRQGLSYTPLLTLVASGVPPTPAMAQSSKQLALQVRLTFLPVGRASKPLQAAQRAIPISLQDLVIEKCKRQGTEATSRNPPPSMLSSYVCVC